MTINLHLPSQLETLKPKITVVGVGGAGGNAVNNMIAAKLEGVDFVIANTDAQALEGAMTDRIIQLGATVTRGLGAGAKPEVGGAAAEEAIDEIADYIHGSNMVFITAGMGGGTGTGAAPIIARLAKEQGMLTVGVVTKPFQFEGQHRMRIAEAGIRELQQYVDTLIVVPNQNLFRIANEKTSFAEAFRLADEVLHSGVRGVTDLIVKPGLINLDFADIRTVMAEMGKAMMGAGEASGEQRAMMAAEAAISNPLLDDVSLKGAKAVLINLTAGPDFALYEVDEAVNRIRDEVDPDANIIVGSAFSDSMEGRIRVSVVATGIDSGDMQYHRPVPEAAPANNSAARKPYAAPMAPTTSATPRKERSAAEIVRQAGTASLTEAIRNAAPQQVAQRPASHPAPQAQPVIRIIDEEAAVQQEVAMQMQQQQAAHNAAQLEQAMQLAAHAAPRAQNTMSDAGPLFVSPRAELPQQRTLFTAQTPEIAEEEYEEAESKSIFGRLANVGKSFTGGAKAAVTAPARAAASMQAAQAAQPERKAEVRETTPHTSDEEEFYDIPAFLRRQAN